jgi:hypothetical protein
MTRVRVTAPRTAARPAKETREAQLRLALVVAAGFLLILGAFPLLLAAVPGLAETRVAGIPFDWLLLGAGIYPLIGLSAWLYIRTAARNEARYRDLAEDQ